MIIFLLGFINIFLTTFLMPPLQPWAFLPFDKSWCCLPWNWTWYYELAWWWHDILRPWSWWYEWSIFRHSRYVPLAAMHTIYNTIQVLLFARFLTVVPLANPKFLNSCLTLNSKSFHSHHCVCRCDMWPPLQK